MRRFTPFIKRGLANRRLLRGRGRSRPNLWVEYIDLVSSESEETVQPEEPQNSEPKDPSSEDDSIESDPSEDPSEEQEADQPREEAEEIQTSPNHIPMNYVNTEETEESNTKKEDSGEETTSRYTPVKYPIFPPLKFGPEEEKEKCYWSLMSPSWGLVQTAEEPKPEPSIDRPMIQLKGEDTELPGSPGFLSTEINAADYWDELRRGNKAFNPYKYMLDYAEASAPFRVPKEENKPKQRDDKTDEEKVEWYRKPYGFTKHT